VYVSLHKGSDCTYSSFPDIVLQLISNDRWASQEGLAFIVDFTTVGVVGGMSNGDAKGAGVKPSKRPVITLGVSSRGMTGLTSLKVSQAGMKGRS